jgi:hypothetical protein
MLRKDHFQPSSLQSKHLLVRRETKACAPLWMLYNNDANARISEQFQACGAAVIEARTSLRNQTRHVVALRGGVIFSSLHLAFQVISLIH